jgi:hypothetical protein
MESEWPELARKLPAGRCMRHGLGIGAAASPVTGAASALPLGGCNRARPADLSATAGICHDATGVCGAS